MDDNIALFDGSGESLDSYTNGTQILIFESASMVSRGAGDPGFDINITTAGDDDLFPEGFTDPDTGTMLTDACVEIGIDDLLDSDQPVNITSASLAFLQSQNPVIGPIDITSFFQNPWDGRLSLAVTGGAGLDIDIVELQLQVQPDPQEIFADGFEEGNTSSWQ